MDNIVLSKDICEKIDHWVTKFPEGKQRSAVLQALIIVQDEYSYLTKEIMDVVADYLQIKCTEVYEVASFYSMYELNPVGKYHIKVCASISCMLCGSNKILDHIKGKLNIDIGQTTTDGVFTLNYAECLASCCDAPVMIINDKKYHENLTPSKVDVIIDNLAKEVK